MNRGSCVDCEEQDAYYIDDYEDELCSTCYNKRIKTDKYFLEEFLKVKDKIKQEKQNARTNNKR